MPRVAAAPTGYTPTMTTPAEQGDITEVLSRGHREVEEMFVRLESLAGGTSDEALELARRAVVEVVRYTTAADDHLYPAVRDRAADGPELAEHEQAEEDDAERTVAKLEGLTPEDSDFWSTVHQLIREFRQHVHEVETEVFPRLREALDAEQLAELGERFERAQRAAPEPPPAGAGPAEGLTDETRERVREA